MDRYSDHEADVFFKVVFTVKGDMPITKEDFRNIESGKLDVTDLVIDLAADNIDQSEPYVEMEYRLYGGSQEEDEGDTY